MEIPSEIVGQAYQMNPATDDVLIDCYELKPGMIILLEDPSLRAKDVVGDLGVWEERVQLVRNRWCRISNIRKVSNISGPQVKFLAEYSDGYKTTRVWDYSTSWLVKKESMPLTWEDQIQAAKVEDDAWRKKSIEDATEKIMNVFENPDLA